MLMIVLSGISGSGKSTIAKRFAELHKESAVILSTDDYFMVDGEYKFNPAKLAEYHNKNKAAAEEACKNKIPFVVIDNTNLKLWEAKPYFNIAHKYGYEIVFERIECDLETSDRNTHGVPREVRQKMLDRMDAVQVFTDYIESLKKKK